MLPFWGHKLLVLEKYLTRALHTEQLLWEAATHTGHRTCVWLMLCLGDKLPVLFRLLMLPWDGVETRLSLGGGLAGRTGTELGNTFLLLEGGMRDGGRTEGTGSFSRAWYTSRTSFSSWPLLLNDTDEEIKLLCRYLQAEHKTCLSITVTEVNMWVLEAKKHVFSLFILRS